MLIVAGVNVWPSAISDVLGRLEPAVTGAFEVLLESPGPKVAPPLRLRVERAPDQPGGPELARAVESHIRDHLVVPCRVEVVDPGTLPRFEMKATYIRRLYEEPAATAGGASR
jgi:phenylacetate-CoA ligase